MGNIVILGPRASGKTTYLASLAYWPNSGRKQKSKIVVDPINQDAKKLVQRARNIILQQDLFEGTSYEESKNLIYQFHLDIEPRFRKKEEIDLVAKDYSGEIWENLKDAGEVTEKAQYFFDEALLKDVVGWLIMLPGWEWQDDESYSQVVKILTDLIHSADRLKDLRLAVAISKCERGEIWPGRLDPEIDLFERRLRKTHSILRQKINHHNLRFYALSTFGVLERNDPRPNRIIEQGEAAVLREIRKWQPYNMISPLYWINTGKRFWDNV